MPKRIAKEQTLENQAIADLATSVSMKQRERIIDMLLKGYTHDAVALDIGVEVEQVNAVADDIKVQLREVDNKRKDEFNSLLMNGSMKAFKKILVMLDTNERFAEKFAVSAAGVMFDKWMALNGTNTTNQTLIVGGNIEDAVGQAVAIISKISNRAGDANEAKDA